MSYKCFSSEGNVAPCLLQLLPKFKKEALQSTYLQVSWPAWIQEQWYCILQRLHICLEVLESPIELKWKTSEQVDRVLAQYRRFVSDVKQYHEEKFVSSQLEKKGWIFFCMKSL